MKSISRGVLFAVLLIFISTAVLAQDSWKGTSGLLHVQDAGTVGRGRLIFSVGSSWYSRNDMKLTLGPRSFYGGIPEEGPMVDYHFFLSRASLTIGLSDYLELATGLNVRNWIMRVQDDGGDLDNRTRGGIGDTDLLLKLCPPMPTRYFQLGVLGSASFPTGNDDRNFTTSSTDFGMKGLFSFNFTDNDKFIPTRLHFNLGYRFNRNEEDGYGILYPNNPDSSGFYPPGYPAAPAGENDNFNDLFEFGTGIEFKVKQTTLFFEFQWDQFLNADFADDDTLFRGYNKNVYTVTPGVRVVSDKGVGLLLAADFNVNSEDSPALNNPPDWAVYFAMSFGGYVIARDADDDGIEDELDKCPNEPEDFDGFEDEDGCPDLDNDNDGIEDAMDECPDLAEDFDGFEDEDGCPDLDNDGDGIKDVDDKCPNEPEDFDGTEDSDGCPDVLQDSDGDGIPDDMDKCPLNPEDMDGYQDDDGCPDPDNDLDGIPDEDDQCPNNPETFNGYKDEDGCPDERPIQEKLILKGVHFESGSAALTPDSYSTLDRVIRSLMAYPEVRVEIRGYTDSVGSYELNKKLSQKRAESVKQYLVNSGIDPERLIARGYGEEDPIASNKSASGRAENRRIEFRRLN